MQSLSEQINKTVSRNPVLLSFIHQPFQYTLISTILMW